MAETVTARSGPLVTIVTYHVVHGRTGTNGLLGRLKGLTAADFAGQLAYIRRHYTPVALRDLADPAALPTRPIVLTFDDGYAAHHDVVLPLLAEANLPAVFFPVSTALIDRTVLDVNKIQCILAATSRVETIVEAIDAAMTPASAEAYRARYWKSSRWDPPDVVYVKRLLQHALPESIRKPLVDSLFASLVTTDERALADELYMTAAQAGALRAAGMTIGAHGDRHVRLSTLDRAAQALEIDGALRALDAAGAPRASFVYSYANGEYNADSVALLRQRGCAFALTTRLGLAQLAVDDSLTLPRLDANDLPRDATAGLSEWTRRADGETAS